MKITNQYLKSKNRVVIPLGDPSGIGIEVTLKALASNDLPQNMQPLLVGCKQTVEFIYKKLKQKGISNLINPRDIEIQNLPFTGTVKPGQPNEETGKASFEWLTYAVNYIIKGHAQAVVTSPIAKHIWHKAGYDYPGQTERIAELAGVKNPSMMFTAISPFNGWRLNTLLATTHIPLNEVSKQLSPELVTSKLNTLLKFCKQFKKSPKLFIAGLNPHAGENGQLGSEEIEWLIPIIDKWKKDNPSINLKGPIPPDTCWISAAKSWQNQSFQNGPDGILAMYHDQGLIPVKLLAFDSAVNTTLGLPFIRTSPDHGTGFDIAGKGIANPASMVSALKTAWQLVNSY